MGLHILNDSDGLDIGVLCIIYRVLRRNGPLTKDDIAGICMPNDLEGGQGPKKFKGTLTFGERPDLKLWQLDDDDKLYLVKKTSSETPTPFEIANCIRSVFFSNVLEDITKPAQKSEHYMGSLFFTLSALLASNNYVSPISDERYAGKARSDFFSSFGYDLNTNEIAGPERWGHFLGFMEILPNNIRVVDPTRAVKEVFLEHLMPDTEVPIGRLKSLVGEHLPVLDGGSYFNQATKVMSSYGRKFEYETSLSHAFSHALHRLIMENIFVKELKKSDNKGVMRLFDPFTGKAEEITHLLFNGVQ